MTSSNWVEAEFWVEYSCLISSVLMELICSCLQIVLFPGILNRCLQLFISIDEDDLYLSKLVKTCSTTQQPFWKQPNKAECGGYDTKASWTS